MVAETRKNKDGNDDEEEEDNFSEDEKDSDEDSANGSDNDDEDDSEDSANNGSDNDTEDASEEGNKNKKNGSDNDDEDDSEDSANNGSDNDAEDASKEGKKKNGSDNDDERKDSEDSANNCGDAEDASEEGKKKKKKKKEKKKEKPEPTIKWAKSKAKTLLYKFIREGRVPGEAKDANGKRTAKLKDIYDLHPEFALYQYSKFSARLSSLRTTTRGRNHRARIDQESFENIISNHSVSLLSPKGYIQWQYSEAQELLKEDLEAKVHETMSRFELYGSRPEYYQNFPLDAFRDKVNQEIRTAKYLYTLKIRGKDARKPKKK
jgi:hypothetical protein